MINQVILGDSLELMQQLPEKSAHTCVTSPPYYALRDYSVAPTTWPEVTFSLFGFPITIPPQTCCLGMESTPMAFIGHMVLIFRGVKRVLRDDGTCWINMGDSYASSGKNRTEEQASRNSTLAGSTTSQSQILHQQSKIVDGLKPKDMIGIPWMLAFALRDDGWYLRSDVIWAKPNPMPESVQDRPTKAHEYIFLLSKSEKYYYDHHAIKTPPKESSFARWDQAVDDQTRSDRVPGKTNGNMKAVGGGQFNIRKKRDEDRAVYRQRCHSRRHAGFNDRWDKMSTEEQMSMGANKRTVWSVPTMPFKEAHFATFPEDIPATCIKAGTSQMCCADCGTPYTRRVEQELVPTPKAIKTAVIDARDHGADSNDQGSNRQKDGHKNGYIYQHRTLGWLKACSCETQETKPCIVLEPFSGAGTTPMVARKLGRDYYAIEKKPEYKAISDKRLKDELGMFI